MSVPKRNDRNITIPPAEHMHTDQPIMYNSTTRADMLDQARRWLASLTLPPTVT